MATNITQQPQTFALCRSPLIVSLYDSGYAATNFRYVLDVFIWHGADASVPATRSFRLSKPPRPDNRAVFDIKDFVASEINQLQGINEITEVTVGDETCVNVLVKAGYTSDAGDSLANTTGERFASTYGYTLFTEGINAEKLSTSANPKYLLTDRPTDIYIDPNKVSTLPIFLEASGVVDDLQFIDWTGNDAQTSLVLSVTNSDDRIAYIPINPSNLDITLDGSRDYTIRVRNSGTETTYATYNVKLLCEPKFEIYQVWFINRYGVWDFIVCSKRSTENIQTEGKEYVHSISEMNAGTLSYNTEYPSITDFNKDGIRRLNLNTGFQGEGLGVMVEQLMLSESILIEFPDGELLPYRCRESSKEIMKSVNERNINYSLSFEAAFNIVNSIR